MYLNFKHRIFRKECTHLKPVIGSIIFHLQNVSIVNREEIAALGHSIGQLQCFVLVTEVEII